MPPREGSRLVEQADALEWLAKTPADPGASVVTSVPDMSEVPELGYERWREWFVDVARRLIRWVPDEGVAIFYQSDVRVAGALVDKGYLIVRAADEERAALVWHKIVCRRPPGTASFGRPSYSHMICVSRTPRPMRKNPGPDVLPDAGRMLWSRAMGLEACRVACRYLADETATKVVVDPFCGRGSVLAIANSYGFDAIGVDISAKRCRAARAFSLDEQ